MSAEGDPCRCRPASGRGRGDLRGRRSEWLHGVGGARCTPAPHTQCGRPGPVARPVMRASADVAELAGALGLGPGARKLWGSSPPSALTGSLGRWPLPPSCSCPAPTAPASSPRSPTSCGATAATSSTPSSTPATSTACSSSGSVRLDGFAFGATTCPKAFWAVAERFDAWTSGPLRRRTTPTWPSWPRRRRTAWRTCSAGGGWVGCPPSRLVASNHPDHRRWRSSRGAVPPPAGRRRTRRCNASGGGDDQAARTGTGREGRPRPLHADLSPTFVEAVPVAHHQHPPLVPARLRRPSPPPGS